MSQRTSTLEANMNDGMSVLLWSKSGSILAVGTSKGNLLMYNHQTSKKIPVLGKHSRRIVCGAWSNQNLLALGSDDKSITVSNTEGDTLKTASLRGEPSQVQFAEMKTDSRANGDNTVSCIVGKKTLYLYNIDDPENPVELAFQSKYGSIVSYSWYGDGYIMLGFTAGIFIVISTHMKEIGQELFQAKDHKDTLTCVSLVGSTSKCATSGDNQVKIHDLYELKNVSEIITVDEERDIDGLYWTEDGQLIAVSAPNGTVYVYLTKLPMLGKAFETRCATLTSLREVTIFDPAMPDNCVVTLPLEVEPTFLAIGPFNLGVGFNNRSWFYRISEDGSVTQMTGKPTDYLGSVSKLCLNAEYAAALFEGRILLHLINQDDLLSSDRESKLFPEKTSARVVAVALTNEFLIYVTDNGHLSYFYMEDWKSVNDYRHSCEIRMIFPDHVGTRLVLIDDKSDGYIYNPVNDQLVEIPDFLPTAKEVIWENWRSNRGVFVAYDDKVIVTYCYSRDTIYGPKVDLVAKTRLPYNGYPLMLFNGLLTCQTENGKPVNVHLDSHVFKGKADNVPNENEKVLKQSVEMCLLLDRWNDAWQLCSEMNDHQCWKNLAECSAKHFEIDISIRAYKHIRDAGTVMSLQSLKDVEDKNLLSGHIAAIFGDFDVAQNMFLASGNPNAALDLRRDLLHWDAAMKLAKTLSPEQVPYISKEYAKQLEFTGDYVNALAYFEKGVTNDLVNIEHDETCASGVARTSIRTGDIRRGVGIALKVPNKKVKLDCAQILSGMKQYSEAAMLFEKGDYFDKAALNYIRLKHWSKVGELLPRVQNTKIHLQFAKAREAEGDYKVAADAYWTANDFESVIRIYLEELNDPQEAVVIAKNTGSIVGAKMVAAFFQKLGEYGLAMEFLVMSKCNNDAFNLAQRHHKMEAYAAILGDKAATEDYKSIAVYFEQERSHYLAGKYFLVAKQYPSALRHLMMVPCTDGESEAIELAIECIGRANDDQLTSQLIDYLMGDTDQVPKDAKYLFRLYMALGQYREAARTAIIIAREEQSNGNYRLAHDVLFGMYAELRKNQIKIPAEMSTNLMILHSYLMVKPQIKLGDHKKAARLLIRVANNISKFPEHVVPILTSAVIECQRAGLRESSFSYASMLMRPEYRSKIDDKYRKKMEKIVIKRDLDGEEEEDLSPCPSCQFDQLHSMDLICTNCQISIPYCIITGKHMTKDDWSNCPACRFHCLMDEFISYLGNGAEVCPMCSEKVNINDLKRLTKNDILDFLSNKEMVADADL